MNNQAPAPPLIDWYVAAVTLPGQSVSGDAHVVAPFPGGVLVAVIDGLGHGPEASAAARAATNILNLYPQESVIELTNRCHEGLKRTRGVAMSLASFRVADNTMTWLGVGNVEGVLFRAEAETLSRPEMIVNRGGVVGYMLPTLRSATLPVRLGDMLIMATDGIHSGFTAGAKANSPVAQVANQILAQFARGTDDALVLAARYLGRPRVV